MLQEVLESMPNLIYYLDMIRLWRINEEENKEAKDDNYVHGPCTPIINVMPNVENPEKKPPLAEVTPVTIIESQPLGTMVRNFHGQFSNVLWTLRSN